ncbi:MAG: hypothetical protein ACRYGR_06775 [Janthinobacterium lividum]
MSRKYVMQEDEDLFENRAFVDPLIKRINSNKFKEIEDIDLENLREFLILVLQSFQEKKFGLNDILNILDNLEIYIHRRYMDEYPETCYPCPSDSEPMSIGLNAIDFIAEGTNYGNLLPNIMEPLLKYLQTPIGNEKESNLEMEKILKELKIKRREKAIHHPDGSYTYTWDQLKEK